MMDGLSGRQLLQRFMLVTAVLAVALVAGGLTALSQLDANRQRNEIGLTFSHLADATARLEVALAGTVEGLGGDIRERLHGAWRSTAYHWRLIDTLNPIPPGTGVRALALGEALDRLAGWEPPHWHDFGGMTLPDSLSHIWISGSDGTAASDLLAEVILAMSPLAHGTGPITRAEAEAALEVRRVLRRSTLLALLHGGSTTLMRDFSAAADAMRHTLVAVIVGGLLTLLLVLLLALRPLANRVGRDQKALRRTLKQAQAADKAKAEFLATMSHELRTPLNGVLGMAALLASTDLSSRQRSCIEIIQSAGGALAALISDILEFSRLDRGELRLRSASFDTEDLARRPGQQLAPAALLKGLELIIRLDPTMPVRLEGDLERLDHVITNLLANAVKFTAQGHVFVDIGARPLGPGMITLRITVADTGPGVAPDKADRIFRLFEQGDQSATRDAGGIGLGLATCSSLVALMGGQIGLDTPVSGVGAQFWAEVPLRVVDPTPWIGPSPVIQSSTIALVTASAARRAIVAEGLGAWGAMVIAAAGVETLRRGCAVHQPDLVIVDDQPPDANAADALHELAERFPGVPTVVLCAHDAVFDQPDCRVIRKPVLPRRLRHTLETVLSEQAARRLLADDDALAGGRAPPASAQTA